MNLLDLAVKIGVEDQASSKLDSISTSAIAKATVIGNAFYDAAKFVAGKAIDMTKAIVGGAVSSYSSYEQLVGGVDKLYGDASGKLQQYAQQAYKTSGMSANQYMQQATSFSAALINSLGGDVDKAADQTDKAMRLMSDNVNTFGSDAEAVQNAIQGLSRENFTMIDNLKLGYAGSREGMQNLIADAEKYAQTVKEMGFDEYAEQMKDTGLSAEELRQRYDELTNSTDLSIDSFSDMIDAIDIIQEKQHIMGTTAREAMTTIEGSVTATKAAWQNFLTAIGSGNEDMIRQSVAGIVSGIFGTFDEESGKRVGGIINNVAPVVIRVGQAIVDEIPSVAGMIGYKFAEMIAQALGMETGYEDSIDTLLHRIGVVMSYKLPTAIKGLLSDALGAVFGDAGREAVESFFGSFDMEPFADAFDRLREAGGTLVDMFVENLPQIGEFLGTALTVVGDLAQAAATMIQILAPFLPSIVAALVAIKAVGIGTAIVSFVSTLGTALAAVQTFGGAISALVTIMGGPVTIIAAVVAAIVAFIATNEDARNAIKAAWEAIKAAVSTAITTVKTTVSEAWNAIKQWTSDTWNAIKTTVSNVFNAIASFVSGALSTIRSTVSSTWESVKSAISNAVQNAYNAVANGFGNVVTYISNLPSNILNALGDLGTLLWNAGSSIITGLWDGMASAAGGLFDWVGSIAGTIASLKGPLPYDKKVLVENGLALMGGLRGGMQKGFEEDVLPYVKGMASDISGNMSFSAVNNGATGSSAPQFSLYIDKLTVRNRDDADYFAEQINDIWRQQIEGSLA